jgi:TorA maturation chaperone TorD
MSGEDNFLARWARRKQAVKEAASESERSWEPGFRLDEAASAAQAGEGTALDAEMPTPHPLGSRRVGLSPEGRGEEAEPDEQLPPIEELDAESDISAFLRNGVPDGLRQAALRRVWAIDPAIRDFVSPAEYAWDFNDPNSIPGFSSSVGSMDLTGFFSGDAAPEITPSRLAQGGAHAEAAAAEVATPVLETATGGVGSDPASSASPQGSVLVEAPAEEPSTPRRAAMAALCPADNRRQFRQVGRRGSLVVAIGLCADTLTFRHSSDAARRGRKEGVDINGVLASGLGMDGIGAGDPATLAPEIAAWQRDETDLARAQEYALLAALLLDPPDAGMLARLARIAGDESPIGMAHGALARAAAETSAEAVRREFFDLFIGVARGEVAPYASFYLTGFLHDRPLAKLREDLRRLGLERAEGHPEPEDHLGSLCEIMSGLAAGRYEASARDEERFFNRHLLPWAERCFTDIEGAPASRLYKAVGRIGRVLMAVEAEAFALDKDSAAQTIKEAAGGARAKA